MQQPYCNHLFSMAQGWLSDRAMSLSEMSGIFLKKKKKKSGHPPYIVVAIKEGLAAVPVEPEVLEGDHTMDKSPKCKMSLHCRLSLLLEGVKRHPKSVYFEHDTFGWNLKKGTYISRLHLLASWTHSGMSTVGKQPTWSLDSRENTDLQIRLLPWSKTQASKQQPHYSEQLPCLLSKP